MDRSREFHKIVAIYETHSQFAVKNVTPTSKTISRFVQIATRGSYNAKCNEDLLEKLSKLCVRKEFSNDPTEEISEVSTTFQNKTKLIKQDLSILKNATSLQLHGVSSAMVVYE